MRYFIEFSYNGKNYHGWQIQTNAITVQQILSQCISLKLKEKVDLIGAGRTDTGVHALQMFAHFDLTCYIDNCAKLVQELNVFLPSDIYIFSIFLVKDDIHARFSALERTYEYFVSNKKNIFNDNLYVFFKDLDICKMNEACTILIGKKDFTSFAKVNTDTMSNNCHIIHAEWKKERNNYIFIISADRFLRNMVRSIVGSLIDVGTGKIGVREIESILAKKDRCEAGTSVPSKGLFLKKIKYPKGIKA